MLQFICLICNFTRYKLSVYILILNIYLLLIKVNPSRFGFLIQKYFYTKLLCEKPMLRQIEWGVQIAPFTKDGVLPVTSSFFRKFDVPTTQMSIFILFESVAVLSEGVSYLWVCLITDTLGQLVMTQLKCNLSFKIFLSITRSSSKIRIDASLCAIVKKFFTQKMLQKDYHFA